MTVQKAPTTAGPRIAHHLDSELRISDILQQPLHDLGGLDRMLLRTMAMLARRKLVSATGLEHVAPCRDPFILVLNHSTRGEALWIPALLVLLRNGRRIHFLADWNFRMIPGLDLLYRRSGAITVPRKSARPRFLNALKPLFTDKTPPITVARRLLLDGRSVGIFPEGTVNRNAQLLRGRYGAARLSLETGVPVVPAGIRFPGQPSGEPIADNAPFSLQIGPALAPPTPFGPCSESRSIGLVQDWHAEIMTALSCMSGKDWQPLKMEKHHADNTAYNHASR